MSPKQQYGYCAPVHNTITPEQIANGIMHTSRVTLGTTTTNDFIVACRRCAWQTQLANST
eukprot:scaffold426_cov66-Skeletonema_dohrnii-CCMP3373.AAC.1